MKFSEVVDQAIALLRRKGRITYRALKVEFDLNDEHLDILKAELIEAQQVAADKDGKMLVWKGDEAISPQTNSSQPQPPASYTPPHLAERIRAEHAAMESHGSTDGERKTITALFADLTGSTALIEGLDPEDARAIIDPALQLMMDTVHRYDGYVAQALGDGIFALFGAPIAHEDHPQRALYAALRMQEAMWGYADVLREKGSPPLLMRVGVNTGEVVVRSIRKDDLHTDYIPVGHSTNLAARMEQLAAPGSILVTAYTHKLTDGYFEFRDLGKTQIKGVEEPLNVYEVIGAGPLRAKLQVAARRGLTRFVGRQTELDQLRRAFDHAKAGHGQIVGVMGEPGLGKSRLFYEFKLTSQHGCLVLEAFSISHGKASPYLPLLELLKAYFQIEPSDDERQRRAKVMGHVLALDKSLEGTLPYILALLGIEDPEFALQQMDAQIKRKRTFEALKKLFLRESLNQPLILIFEDLHWIDSETQGFLDALSESVASANLLLLVNYRPEYRHEWGRKTYYTQLRLAPLGKDEAGALLTFLLGSDPSLTGLQALILEKTEGTPFFMEEVVQTLVEEGALSGERGHYRLETTSRELHISPTVQGVLAARIDRLTPEEKEMLQQLSVIGRQFSLSLIRQVVAKPEEELYRVLASLQSKEFLYEQPAFPEVEYIFKHVLTQEVAYGTVLQDKRKALHEQIAEAVEASCRESLEDHYRVLVHRYRLLRAEVHHARQQAEEFLHLAQGQRDNAALLEAHFYLGDILFWLGEFNTAQEHFQHSLDFYDPLRHRPQTIIYGQDSGMFAHAYLAWTLWYQGYPDQALTQSREAINLARELSHPYNLSLAFLWAAELHALRGESREVEAWSGHTVTQTTEHGFPLPQALGTVVQGGALVEQGRLEDGMTLIRQGMTAFRATDAVIATPWLLLKLVEAYKKTGQPEAGLKVLEEVSDMAHMQGVLYCEAELRRLKGELTIQLRVQSPEARNNAAEACFHKAIEVARHQQAKSWELRAATSLARLWRQQGKKTEARELLAPVYNWFTEGFDTKDLREAKALLDE